MLFTMTRLYKLGFSTTFFIKNKRNKINSGSDQRVFHMCPLLDWSGKKESMYKAFSKITPACLYWTLFAVLYFNIETILLHVNISTALFYHRWLDICLALFLTLCVCVYSFIRVRIFKCKLCFFLPEGDKLISKKQYNEGRDQRHKNAWHGGLVVAELRFVRRWAQWRNSEERKGRGPDSGLELSQENVPERETSGAAARLPPGAETAGSLCLTDVAVSVGNGRDSPFCVLYFLRSDW